MGPPLHGVRADGRTGRVPGLDVDEAFRRNTDGPDCPISRNYRGDDFVAVCERAGFEAEFLGGYLLKAELRASSARGASAIVDERLAAEHREFLRALTLDLAGRPMYRGSHAGIGDLPLAQAVAPPCAASWSSTGSCSTRCARRSMTTSTRCGAFSRARCLYANALLGPVPGWMRRIELDAIVFHTSFLSAPALGAAGSTRLRERALALRDLPA